MMVKVVLIQRLCLDAFVDVCSNFATAFVLCLASIIG